MKKALLLLILIILWAVPVNASEFSAPEVPVSGQKYFPDDTESFGEGLWQIIKEAIAQLQPSFAEAAGISFRLIAVSLLAGMLNVTSGKVKETVSLVSVVGIGALLLEPSNALMKLGISTVTELSEYGKLLAPVMTGILAAQGGVTASGALYAGTTVFNTILNTCITELIVPMIYIYIALCIADRALREQTLKNLRDFVKWLMTWCLKIVLYVFTGYMSITGVVSGAADASAIKATKLTLSGVVPVVGGIISDASEAVLTSATVIKNATGIYGLLAIMAVWIAPFLQVGIQYLLLKLTAGVCGIFGNTPGVGLIKDFAAVMGLILAMIGTVSLLLMISTVCFMKGVS